MKIFTAIMKVLAAMAAVAGIVYVIATYGDKIVAWSKKLLDSCPCRKGECNCGAADANNEAPAEEVVAEEVVAEEIPVEEEVPVEEVVPVADETDFEG